MRDRHRLGFPLLVDSGLGWSRALGLVFELPDDLREIYLGFGIDLAEYHAAPMWELPLPARIVVDAGGAIRSLEADPDYTRRPEVDATLEVLRGLG